MAKDKIETEFLKLLGMNSLTVHEFFTFLGKVKKADQASYLRRFCESQPFRKNCMRGLAEMAYHPRVILELPEGAPPYNNLNDLTTASNSLYKVIKQVVYFIKGNPSFVSNAIKREGVYIKILETLSKEEAEIFINAKDGNMSKYKGFSEDLIREAYPKWLPKKQEWEES
jgi:hypothetical protein